ETPRKRTRSTTPDSGNAKSRFGKTQFPIHKSRFGTPLIPIRGMSPDLVSITTRLAKFPIRESKAQFGNYDFTTRNLRIPNSGNTSRSEKVPNLDENCSK